MADSGSGGGPPVSEGQAAATLTEGAGRRRLLAAYVLPSLAVLATICLPLILGQRTLYLRDAFGTHLEMKWFQAESLRAGELPLIDPYRSGGQAHLGNPNTVPLYPGNLLYLVASTLWAFNAHFWAHLLLAPMSFYWLARRWRIGREAAWMGGVAYAASGYFLSTLNLYNLVAPAALAPALIAACLAAAEERRPRAFLAVVGLWAAVLLGGDPMTAGMALLLALAAVMVRRDLEVRGWGPVAGGLALGTLVALPQLVEFARILGHSYRGHWGYSAAGSMAASWNPASALEWLLPLVFGWPDLGFWGRQHYGGELPLFFSLAPGALAIALALGAGRPARVAAWWAWGAIAFGLFVALGRYNPVIALLAGLPGLDLVRLPVKFWLLVAIGGSLLCALGFERLRRGRPRLPARLLTLLLGLYAALWVFLSFGGAAAFGLARRWIPDAFGNGLVEQERLRWAGVALISLLVVAAALGVIRLAERRRALLALLPLLHLASQLLFLRPLLSSDEVAPYLEPPALLEVVPEDAAVVHGDAGSLFGQVALPLDRYPDVRLIWLQRQTHEQLYPPTGMRWHRRYELHHSPEGLDAFLTRATAQAARLLPDPARIKLLEASGVDRLLVSRRLEVLEAAGQVELLHTAETVAGPLYVYRIPNRVEPARMVGSVVRSPHLNGTLEVLTRPDFDARTETVLPGDGPASRAPAGRVRWIERGAESMVLEVDSPAGGALVIQRTPLPILRAEVDGVRAAIQPADLHRIGIELEPGSHRVRVWAERTPLRVSAALALLALVAAPLAGRRLRRDC